MIVVESQNPNPKDSPFEKAAHAAMTWHYAAFWFNREHGGNWPWHVPDVFLGRRFRQAWRCIERERKGSFVERSPS
jgi:hypothetical protein